MGSRVELQGILESVLGTPNVYFQPPETVKMLHPCIRYEWDASIIEFANDTLYINRRRYRLIVMDYNPDSEIPDKIARLPLCKFDRHYTANNLHHFSFNIFY